MTDSDHRFTFELAARLGMTAAELGRRMSQTEFEQWAALSRVEARERERDDRRAGRGR